MKLKQTMRKLFLGSFLVVGLVGVNFTTPLYAIAAKDNNCGVDTAIITCGNVKGQSGVQGSAVWSLLLTAINILTAGVGVLALAGLIWGAILYTSAGGSAEQIKKAREVFTNVVIGVIAFAGMYALLNFIIPGGVFTT